MEKTTLSTKFKDLLLLFATIFLFIINPVFHLIKDFYAIVFALAILALFYFSKSKQEESYWKNKFIREFFFRIFKSRKI